MVKKIIAFTLAEVLLVASIIGVIGALTIPNLQKEHDRKVYAAKAKAAFAKLDAALQQVDMVQVLNGISESEYPQKSLAVHNEMKKYLKLKSDCGLQTGSNHCFTKDDFTDSGYGAGFHIKDKDYCTTAILNDNTEYAMCIVFSTPGNIAGLDNYMGYLVVDVDGANKGPTTRGKDVYIYFVTDSGLVIPPKDYRCEIERRVFKTGLADE